MSHTSPSFLNLELSLPCGALLRNRIAKAAMTERLSDADYHPNEKHIKLYKTWAEGGAGLMITGNIMVDHRSLESAGNVAVEDESSIAPLKRWTDAGKSSGHHMWAQLGHPGRQTSILVNSKPVSASDVKLEKLGLFAKPRGLYEEEIQELITRFAKSALLCKQGGFTGVQIHAAHGYLLSQFLSPLTNQRQDKWGGSLKNRSRLLMSIVRKTRELCGKTFPIGVKLNSADFQRGGFEEEDSLSVIQMLEHESVDLLEVSGGTYEKIAFFQNENKVRQSTKKREAYFLDFARKVRSCATLPLMVTGGFRTPEIMSEAIAEGDLDVVGVARPFLWHKHYPAPILAGETLPSPPPIKRLKNRHLNDIAEAGFYDLQLQKIAEGHAPGFRPSMLRSAAHLLTKESIKAGRKRIK